MKRALITGARGQDGRYLTDLLRERGYDVVPLEGDVRDDALITRIVQTGIDEIYNLAGGSFGPESWRTPVETGEVLGLAVARILEVIRKSGRPVRFFQASSSELFGNAPTSPQNEQTPFHPLTPYGAAKLYAHRMVEMYRRHHHLYACCGILFNHESPLRRPEFVTRKVTRAAAGIHLGMASELRLGNLDVSRDWSFAGDFADAMWRMLQQEEPDDYVLASGERHTIRELCEVAFSHVGLDYRDYVVVDPQLFRAEEFDRLGDPSKARERLGWSAKVGFRQLIGMMVAADVESLRQASS